MIKITFETPKLSETRPFYENVWGLTNVPSANEHAEFLKAEGEEPWVFGFTHGEQAKMTCLRLGLATRALVDQAAEILTAEGVALLSEPGLLAGPGDYYGLAFVDPDGRAVELSATDKKINARSQNPLKPSRLSHVVLNSMHARATADFYVRVLGFTVSDWYEKDAIIFLRCNDDHHCVGIGQGSNAKLNHAAFLLPDQEAVVRAGERVQSYGALPIWGPGRHGPGGNVFVYHKDPSDFVIEYTAELIQIGADTNWVAKEWRRTPENANVWGTGGPTASAIELMSGEHSS
jgi:catechol-2,3-dioxygenase